MSHIATVGSDQYHVVERAPFEFYIKGDMIQNVDENHDSVVVLTQMSEYIFETIKTNGGVSQERIMVKSSSSTTSRSGLVPEGMQQNNTREFLSEETENTKNA